MLNPYAFFCKESLPILKEFNSKRHYVTEDKDQYNSFNTELRNSDINSLKTAL